MQPILGGRDDHAILEAEQIGRCLGTTEWLLRDVSLTIRAGQRIAIVGPTGSGKTLLLRALALLDPLDAGRVLWKGEPVAPHDVPAFRSRVIYLHQHPALFPGTVEENLQRPYRLRAHGTKRFQRKRVVDLLREVDRDENFLAKSGRDLSGGERQMTALLRAIQLDPALLLLDEPTAALDSATAEAVERLVRHWQGGGQRSFVWVSHEARQVERIAGRICTMRNGQLTEEP